MSKHDAIPKFKKGSRVRLVSGTSVGTVRLRSRFEGTLVHLVEWDNGNEPSFHIKSDLVLL